jgi:hypothetical protein
MLDLLPNMTERLTHLCNAQKAIVRLLNEGSGQFAAELGSDDYISAAEFPLITASFGHRSAIAP